MLSKMKSRVILTVLPESIGLKYIYEQYFKECQLTVQFLDIVFVYLVPAVRVM